MILDTHICGIPCRVKVTGAEAGTPGVIHADPTLSSEREPDEISFEVLDRRSRPAPWLQNKLTTMDDLRIQDEIYAALEAANEAYYED